MDAFSYLSVLISIIIGLAITQILQGYRGLLLARERVRPHASALMWSALVLFIAVQMWWSSFGLAKVRQWTFVAFGVVLLQSVFLYLLAGLALPDVSAGERVDLVDHYDRERRFFFAALLCLLATSALKDQVLDGHPPTGWNLVFHLAFATLTTVSLLSGSRRWHALSAPVAALLMVAYVALLFAALPV